MAASNQKKSRAAAVAVTTQPRQRHQHLEPATSTEMVNPKAAMGRGDRPAPPPPPTDYGYGGDGSDSYRHRQEEARAAEHVTVRWGLWMIGELIGDCLVRQISKPRRNLEDSKPVYGSSGGGGGNNSTSSSGAEKRSSAKKRATKLSDYTLIATVQVLLGSEHGTTSGRRVTFNTVPEVKYVDKCMTLYPPTLKGIEMRRKAFWSEREVQDNETKWEGHLETYELGRNGYETTCKCLGCVADGEETNF